jgi:hypothetical protein
MTLLVGGCQGGSNSDAFSNAPNGGGNALIPPPPGTPLSGQLDRSKLTMSSVQSVDLTLGIARVPLFKGTYKGTSVWFVRMDVS